MDLFSGALPFVCVVEERSFGEAAKRLGVSTAAVSKAVARLESELKVRLLNRSSRNVAPTPEGAQLYAHYQKAVIAVKQGREDVAQSRHVVEGELVVSMPQNLAGLLVPRLPSLLALHPALSFRISVTDRFSRLLEEGIDVAVRIGELDSSSLVSRQLRTVRNITVASPSYLARAGVPRTPMELLQHNCLRFALPRGGLREWSFVVPPRRTPETIPVRGNLVLDSGDAMIAATLAGMGISHALDFMIEEHLRDGRLVEVLSDFASPGPVVRALCLPGRKNVPRVRAFMRFLDEVLGQSGPKTRR
jgi:DNA-binding transcriptional LysR family regulator